MPVDLACLPASSPTHLQLRTGDVDSDSSDEELEESWAQKFAEEA